MKAIKYMLTVEAEGLDVAVFRGLLHDVLDGLENQKMSGKSEYLDGDVVEWSIETEEVKF